MSRLVLKVFRVRASDTHIFVSVIKQNDPTHTYAGTISIPTSAITFNPSYVVLTDDEPVER